MPKVPIVIYKILHGRLNIEQHELYIKLGMNECMFSGGGGRFYGQTKDY